MLGVFEVGEAVLWVAIEVFRSVFVVSLITFEPFLEPHGAHDVVIGHRVEGVESVFDFLLRT